MKREKQQLSARDHSFLEGHLPIRELKALANPGKGRQIKVVEKMRHEKLRQGLRAGKTKAQAMIEAGYAKSTALQGTSQLAKSVREIIDEERLAFMRSFQDGIKDSNFTGAEASIRLVGIVRSEDDLLAINAIRTLAHVQRSSESLETPKQTFNLGVFVVPDKFDQWEGKAKELYTQAIEAERINNLPKPDK